jgi:iron complex outermembrane receptor protein
MPAHGYTDIRDDSEFKNTAVFGEITEELSKGKKVIPGYRGDYWSVVDRRTSMSSDTAGQTRTELTNSGFARLESQLSNLKNTNSFIGVGRSERMPDYWELISNRRDGSAGANNNAYTNTHSALQSTKTEKTYQIDAGVIHKSNGFDFSGSVFYNQINDFILVDARSGFISGEYRTPTSRNIDAQTHGAELMAGYALTNLVKVNSSIAYVKGKNKTDGLPLAQLAPLEGRLSLAYDDKKYSYGALLRLVAPKDEVAVGQGNISGQDIAKSGGFGIFSLNAGYKPNKKTLIAAGVDNLFDKTYSEFISRTGNPMGLPAGYVTSTRINEPGRTAWLKATIALD